MYIALTKTLLGPPWFSSHNMTGNHTSHLGKASTMHILKSSLKEYWFWQLYNQFSCYPLPPTSPFTAEEGKEVSFMARLASSEDLVLSGGVPAGGGVVFA